MNIWKKYRIGELAEVTSSKRIFLSDYVSEGIPFYRSREIIEKHKGNDISLELFIKTEQYEAIKDKFGVPLKNDILLTSVGTIGVPYLVKENEVFYFKDGNLTWFRKLKGKIIPQYLYQWIKSELGQKTIQTSLIGSSQAALTISDIKKLKLFLPEPDEQERIASILSAYDELIENNNKRIAILEQMAEQIYKEWFVRMRFPGYEKAEFEKGVPKGWLKELRDYIKVVKGKSYTGEEINEIGEGKPFVNLKSFNRGGGYRYDGIKFYTGKYHEKQLVKEGGIIMAVTDMTQDRAVVGRVARIPKTQYPEMVISLDSAKIIPDKKLPNAFFYATLRFGFFGNTIKEFANGSNVLHLKPELAYQMKSIIPDDEALIKKFDKIIEPYFNLIDNLNLENQNLKQTRALLLPRLISGKLRVKDLETVTKKEKV